MQIKVDFLCRDSILAAPIVLDLVLFLDLAQRAGLRGISGVAQLLLQVSHGRSRALSRARSLHSINEAEKHPAMDGRRRPDHSPRPGILRLARIFHVSGPLGVYAGCTTLGL